MRRSLLPLLGSDAYDPSQVNSIGAEGGAGDASGGPLWGRFFGGMAGDGADEDGDTESMISGQGGSELLPPHTPSSSRMRPDLSLETPGSEVFPNDSASVVYDDNASELGRRGPAQASSIGATGPPPPVDDGTYLFKFVAPGGTTHRFQARYDSHDFITDIVGGKLSSDPFFAHQDTISDPAIVGADPADFQLSYHDDDGDLVLMTADRDVVDAVHSARAQGKDRVVLHLRGGRGWDAEIERRGLAKKKPVLKVVSEAEEEEEDKPKMKGKRSAAVKEEELLFGFLAKDQLLPASVALLAVAIVGVFAVNKATAK